MKPIKIFINDIEFGAVLNDTKTAEEIYKILPIEAEGNFWGNEIYFEIPVMMPNEKPTEEVEVGDLGYWPIGKSFCIFYGRTPVSTTDKPKPASAVTIIGKIKGNLEELKKLKKARVRIIKE
jgi:hypothetical protein